MSIWSVPQDRRSPPHPPPLVPVGQRARSGLPAVCYERLWVSSSDYCWGGGGFTQYLHLSHPQMRLLFLSLSLSCSITLFSHSITVSFSITLSGMLPVSLTAGVWFSLPPLWFHLSGRFFLPCSKEKHKTHGGRCSPSLSSSSSLLSLSLSCSFFTAYIPSLFCVFVIRKTARCL